MNNEQLAIMLGKIARVATTRIVNFVKSTILDIYANQDVLLRYDSLRMSLFSFIKNEISDFANNLIRTLREELGLEIDIYDYESILSLGMVIADVTAGEIFWRLFGRGVSRLGIDVDLFTSLQKHKEIIGLVDFFDVTVYNILLDGLYKLIRNLLVRKLLNRPDARVRWYSMNGKFKHPICKQRYELISTIKQMPKVFNLHEKRYNWLHPHFLCDGVFLPEEG